MEVRRLGQTDLSISSISLGCVTFDREIDQESSHMIMDHAVEQGINLFDTAEAYADGASEIVVGNWLKSRGNRDQIELKMGSKTWRWYSSLLLTTKFVEPVHFGSVYQQVGRT